MKEITWACIFLLLTCTMYGQNQSNPFDLQFRPSHSKSVPSKSIPDPIQPDTVSKAVPQEMGNVNAEMNVLNSIPSEDSIKKDTPVSFSSNPFEISDEPSVDTTPHVSTTQPAKEDDLSAPVERKTSKGIQIFFLLLSLLFLIFIVNVERSFVRDLWRVISNENYSSLHHRNQRNTMRQILLLMGYLVFIIQAGIFLYHSLGILGYQGTLLDNIWTCLALIFAVYLVRHSVIRYLKWLFNNDKEMTLFGFDIGIFNIMVGLVLLPVNILLNFGPESMAKPLIIIGIIAFCMAYLLRQFRWLLTARQLITGSLFLFFVYLCAVEILPLWAISKIFW